MFAVVLWASGVSAAFLEKLSDHVYAFAGIENASPENSFASNSGVIIGEKGVLVVDTRVSAKEAEQLIQQINTITQKPILYAVNTHFHFDHSLGNCAFKKKGALILSHEKGRLATASLGDKIFEIIKPMGMTEELLEGTTLSYPEITFSSQMRIDLGGVEVELIYLAPGHSPDNILVYVPKDKVLFAGDILFSDFHAYMGTADLEGWQKNLDHIMAMDASYIVPGHGPVSGKKEIQAQMEYLVAFDRLAGELTQKTDDPELIIAEMKKKLPQKSQGEWMIRANLLRKYLKPKN